KRGVDDIARKRHHHGRAYRDDGDQIKNCRRNVLRLLILGISESWRLSVNYRKIRFGSRGRRMILLPPLWGTIPPLPPPRHPVWQTHRDTSVQYRPWWPTSDPSHRPFSVCKVAPVASQNGAPIRPGRNSPLRIPGSAG